MLDQAALGYPSHPTLVDGCELCFFLASLQLRDCYCKIFNTADTKLTNGVCHLQASLSSVCWSAGQYGMADLANGDWSFESIVADQQCINGRSDQSNDRCCHGASLADPAGLARSS
ncbi:hypothetical protein WJX77_005144 [Trebouxia sp. C0004]